MGDTHIGTSLIAKFSFSMGEEKTLLDDPRLPFLLLAVGLASLAITVYHCLAICWASRRARQVPPHRQQGLVRNGVHSIDFSSMVQLIPAHKYEKDMKLVGEDGVCAVCLCEFEEGEELRTLPECMHSFHVPCIDMWLYSHPNCPVCRTDATPSPLVSSHVSESRPVEVETRPEARALQDIVLQTRRV